MFSVFDCMFGRVLIVHYLLGCFVLDLQGKLNNASQIALSYQQKIRNGGLLYAFVYVCGICDDCPVVVYIQMTFKSHLKTYHF